MYSAQGIQQIRREYGFTCFQSQPWPQGCLGIREVSRAVVLACAVHTPSELQVAVSEGGHTGSGWWMSMVRSFALYSPVWKLILHILTQCCFPVGLAPELSASSLAGQRCLLKPNNIASVPRPTCTHAHNLPAHTMHASHPVWSLLCAAGRDTVPCLLPQSADTPSSEIEGLQRQRA